MTSPRTGFSPTSLLGPAELPDEAAAPARSFECDACGQRFDGEPYGAGLYLWTRGDEVRFEEPPLCEKCATEITVGAHARWASEDEEEG